MNYRIMETDRFVDAIFYRASCDCGSKECDVSLELEFDKDFNEIILNMYKDLRWDSRWGDNWLIRLRERIFGSLRILVTGRVRVEAAFIFDGGEHIRSFIDMIESGVAKLEQRKLSNANKAEIMKGE